MTNYYQTLGVPHNATSDQIKAAYREYVKHYHPDLQNNSEFFKRRFQEVQQAYEVLSNMNKRAFYDRQFSNGKSTTQNDNSQYATTIEKLNREIESLKTGIANTENIIRDKDKLIKDKDSLIKSKDDFIESKNKTIAELSRKLEHKSNNAFYNNTLLGYPIREVFGFACIIAILCVCAYLFANPNNNSMDKINLALEYRAFIKMDSLSQYNEMLSRSNYLLQSGKKIDGSYESLMKDGRKLDMTDMLYARAVAKKFLNNDTGAIRDLTDIISDRKIKSSQDYSLRAEIKMKLGDSIGAHSDLYNAIGLDQKDLYSRTLRAKLLWNQKRYLQAIQDYKIAVEINSRDVELLNEYGICFYYTNKPDSACVMWRKASELGSEVAFDNIKNFCK